MHAMKRYQLALLMSVLLLAQGMFAWEVRKVRPEVDVVPTPPSEAAVHALALGDDEFYFRFLSLRLQNFGDMYGKFTALRYYDYTKLYQWMLLMDGLNARSQILPTLAAYYYSQTQNKPDVRYMVEYLYTQGVRDLKHKWWWLLQAIYLSMHRLNDMELAVRVAEPMLDPAVPVWAQQMVAVVHEKNGEMDSALSIMESIQKNAGELSEMDLKYMRYFIEERLHKLEEWEKNTGKPLE